jgi:hypothetical protein
MQMLRATLLIEVDWQWLGQWIDGGFGCRADWFGVQTM